MLFPWQPARHDSRSSVRLVGSPPESVGDRHYMSSFHTVVRTLNAMALAALIAGCTTPVFGGRKVVLVKDGRPAATIIIADDPVRIPVADYDPKTGKSKPLTVAYAAAELQSFIAKATGVTLPVVAASPAPAKGTLVLVGRSALSDQAGLPLPTRPEGLRIVPFGRGLAILGEIAPRGTNGEDIEMDRGTLHGVYEFLERGMGYRFYFPLEADPELGIVTPSLKNLIVPRGFGAELAPDFPLRVTALGLPWMRSTREGTSTGFTCGTTDDQWNPYRQDHPEYFALLKDGSRHTALLCHTELKVLAQRLENIEVYYKTGKWGAQGGYPSCMPTAKYVQFLPSDTPQAVCQCARCLTLTRKAESITEYGEGGGGNGTASDLIFRHGSDLAVEVGKRWPGRRVSMLAYYDYMLPPSFDIPGNLDVQVCLKWSGTMNKESYWHQRNLKLLRDWSAKVQHQRDRLSVFNYICTPSFWTEAPIIFPHNLRQWFQDTYAISSGELVCPGGQNLQRQHYMSWLWHRLMWDRNADVDALLRDYATRFYGPAGQAMEAFYRVLADRYENVHWSQRLGVSYVPPELMYLETFTPEVVARLKKLLADALAACPTDPADICRRRVVWMQEGFAPFFTEADLSHKWLNHAPVYTATTVKEAPDETAWASAAPTPLMQGNFGSDPDLQTTVQALKAGQDLYVRFVAAQTTPPPVKDGLTLRLAAPDQPYWTLSADGTTEGKLAVTVVSNQRTDIAWTVVVKVPITVLPADGKAQVQFERHLETAGKDKTITSREYAWSPQMAPPWPSLMRWGALKIGE
jgi:hypothetical protein